MPDDDLLVLRLRIQQHERTAIGDGYLFGEAADEIERLRADLESTRQAWVNGDDPMCDDVCLIACKGPCGQGGTTNA